MGKHLLLIPKGIRVQAVLSKLSNAVLLFSYFICCIVHAKSTTIDGDDIIPAEPPWYFIFTLSGLDSDKDQVRDDVELWINAKSKDVNIRRALKSLSKIYLGQLESYDNREEYMRLRRDRDLRDACLSFFANTKSATNSYHLSSELRKKIYNTPYRSYYASRGEENVESGSYSIPKVKIYERAIGCDFKVSNLWEIIQEYKKKYPKWEMSDEDKTRAKDMYENNPSKYNAYDILGIHQR